MFTNLSIDPTTARLLDDEHRARLSRSWGRRTRPAAFSLSFFRSGARRVPSDRAGQLSDRAAALSAAAPGHC